MTDLEATACAEYIIELWPKTNPKQCNAFAVNVVRHDLETVWNAITSAHADTQADGFCPFSRIYQSLPALPIPKSQIYRDAWEPSPSGYEPGIDAAWAKLDRAEREKVIRRATVGLGEKVLEWELGMIDRDIPSRTLWAELKEEL